VQFSPRRANAIIQGALDSWQVEQPRVIHGRWKRALLLAAATFAVASAAAGLLYVGYADRPAPSISPVDVRPSASPKPADKPVLTPDTEINAAASSTPGTSSTARDESSWRTAPPRPRPQLAEDLLLVANKLRAQRKWSAAEQTYRRVCTLYPNSASAYVASIAAGSIRLEHLADPRGALDAYSKALAVNPRGALDIEARLGLARSWQQLGDRDREIAALRTLLQKHASGPMVQRARERLEAIAGDK
jgi:tetratricopeptide (TPR) repeat protein